MKKTLILLTAILGFAVVASAQPRALGVRAGYNHGAGGELSYQHSLGSNFAEFDLGWFNGGFSLNGLYDFIIAGTGEVNLYAGPGAEVIVYNTAAGSNLNVGIAGQLGVEWNFPAAPIQLSLDWRPVYLFLNDGLFGYDSVGLGLRYRF